MVPQDWDWPRGEDWGTPDWTVDSWQGPPELQGGRKLWSELRMGCADGTAPGTSPGARRPQLLARGTGAEEPGEQRSLEGFQGKAESLG